MVTQIIRLNFWPVGDRVNRMPLYLPDVCFRANDCLLTRIGLEKSNILSEHGGSLYIQDLSSLLYPMLHTFSSKWERCWRAQIDGWTASTFHGNCDYRGQTVTIVRVGSYIFGGYTSINWTSKLTCQGVIFFSLKEMYFNQSKVKSASEQRGPSARSVS